MSLLLVPTVIFCVLAERVVTGRPFTFDITILQWLHRHSTHSYDKLFVALTTFGSVQILGSVAFLTVLYLFYKNQRGNGQLILFSVTTTSILNIVLKQLFQRHRPELWQSAITETDFSFPSGHAMLSCTFALSLIVIAWPTHWKWPMLAAGATMTIGVGLSRMYLGVHYPSDIIAGWCASGIMVCAAIATVNRLATT